MRKALGAALAGLTALLLIPLNPALTPVASGAHTEALPTSRAAPPHAAHHVTLTTGDRVLVTDLPGGKHTVTVEPGPGREDMAFYRTGGRDAQGHDRIKVVPADVAPQIASGRLDDRLFDVSGLVRAGYDDASRVDPAALPEPRDLRPAAEEFTLTIKAMDRDGRPTHNGLPHFLTLVDLNPEPQPLPDPELTDGTATVRLPKGSYGLTGSLLTPTGDTPQFETSSITVAATPRLTLDRDLTVTLDARAGKRVTATVDAPNPQRAFGGIDLQFGKANGGTVPFISGVGVYGDNELYAIPVTAPADDDFSFGHQTVLSAPKGSAPYAYQLAFPVRDRIPADPRFRVRNAELATVHNRYHAQGVDAALGTSAEAPVYLPGQALFSGPFTTVPLPSRRTDFFTTGGTEWTGLLVQRTADQPQQGPPEGANLRHLIAFEASTVTRQNWNNAVFGPEIDEHGWGSGVIRHGDDVQVVVPSFAPGARNLIGMTGFDFSYVTGSTTLSLADGSGGATTPVPGSGYFTVPADRARYVLDIEARRDREWTTLSTEVRTVWTFTSGHADGSAYEQLPVIRISGAFDAHNRAPESSWLPLELNASTQAGAPASAISELTLEISQDDGKTWRSTPVRHHGGDRWRAAVLNPGAADGTRHISLRAKAKNAAGNTVEQTILRAYALSTG